MALRAIVVLCLGVLMMTSPGESAPGRGIGPRSNGPIGLELREHLAFRGPAPEDIR